MCSTTTFHGGRSLSLSSWCSLSAPGCCVGITARRLNVFGDAWPATRKKVVMRRVQNVLIQILIFVAVIVAISALAIWLNLGPVVHSAIA